ncbi:DUF3095 family protein [Ramlibacter sp. AN1015]|uniref:DUF3095 family protein n=1 Tax=Ramlibacter sp. AN1015 TaxID=3133428 RepID=UPI0030C1BD11
MTHASTAIPSPLAPAPDLSPYYQAPRLDTLQDWCNSESFAVLPDDWLVFVADVEQSTRAIEQGRYKHVNAVGAACIVAAANACGRDDLPFCFGGDGATVVVPAAFDEALSRAWRGLQAQVAQGLGLRLRVGRVPVADLRARGATLRVARRSLSAGFEVALFAGGALTLADHLVKSDPARYQLAAGDEPAASVEGLECRWNDVPSRNGRILTLLVRARGDDAAVLSEVMAQVEQTMPVAAPVRLDNLPPIWPPRHLGVEMALRRPGRWSGRALFMGLWAECAFFAQLMRRHKHDARTSAGRYASELVSNTDHLKLDDTLRAVLDVTGDQAARLESLLERLHAEGKIDYGLHYSDHALITCFVRSLERHLHFVDGGGGGYHLAAAQLKASGSQAWQDARAAA